MGVAITFFCCEKSVSEANLNWLVLAPTSGFSVVTDVEYGVFRGFSYSEKRFLAFDVMGIE